MYAQKMLAQKYSPGLTCCFSLAIVLCLAACGGSGTAVPTISADQATSNPLAISSAKSSLTRNPLPVASDADVAAAVAGNTEFALKALPLLDAIGDSNLVYSPYSITQALAMTSAGAKGETLTGIEQALAFQLQQNRLFPALNRLDLQLAEKTSAAGNTKLPSLNIANALWVQQAYSLQPAYLDALGVNFGAVVNLLDFTKAPEASRLSINSWVEQQTQQKIKNLLGPNDVSSNTRVVLTNAIWFKADWATPFTAEKTSSQNFTDRKGNTRSLPFMSQDIRLPYVQGKSYQAVELPYVDNKLSMLLIMPDAGKFDDFVQNLNSTTMSQISAALKEQYVALSLPKFNFSSAATLADVLGKLGMSAAFDASKADFSGMTGNRDLSVSAIVHKAFINVDEKGTEAAAATGVVVGVTSVIVDTPIKVTLDHPFLFMIRDRQTGLIIFIGKLMNPAGN
ncbi:serpin family protein [Undibacterium sp. Di26W]|uniref:serpin family protein n=1 Tax=Undibacterium sp. Di26W TaxID=3413035 RepID=UPI003BF21AFD